MDPKSSTNDIFQVLHRIKQATDAKLEILEQVRLEIVREHATLTRIARQAAGRVG